MALEQLMPAWIIIDNEFTDYACEDHAREYAADNGIPEISADSYTEFRHGYGVSADVYRLHSWEGHETDYPAACKCGQYLDVDLTREGIAYTIENEFPAWLLEAHRITIEGN